MIEIRYFPLKLIVRTDENDFESFGIISMNFWSSPDLKVSHTPSRPSSVVKTYDKVQKLGEKEGSL